MSSEVKVTTQPVVSTESVVHPIVLAVNDYIRQTESCTPVGAAKKFLSLAAECGLCLEEDGLLYNFDYRYKVKFKEDGRPQVAVFWAPWIGGVSWKIEDDVCQK